jgi:demethylmenaquinone methyltransferase/2-methoxy-6-polyprenyl-1,4-benzoquinol methylase
MNTMNTKFDFDDIAERYDRCNHLFSFGMDYRWRRRVVKALNPQMQQHLLDLCTGTGDLVFAFLKHSPVRHVTGVDLNERMLSLAQEKQIRLASKSWLRNKRIHWSPADAACTGLASNQFDFVSCAFGLRNIPDRSAVLTEIHRLLKPHGKLCILEFSLPANPLLRFLYRFYLNILMPTAGRLVVDSAEPLKYLADSIHHWHTNVNFPNELAAGGFTLVRKSPLSGGIVTLWLARK